jgi:hypothetical protein
VAKLGKCPYKCASKAKIGDRGGLLGLENGVGLHHHRHSRDLKPMQQLINAMAYIMGGRTQSAGSPWWCRSVPLGSSLDRRWTVVGPSSVTATPHLPAPWTPIVAHGWAVQIELKANNFTKAANNIRCWAADSF